MRSRTTLNAVTPNQNRYSTVPQTAEKEKPPTEDRQAVHEKTQIVMDELSRLNVPEFQEILTKGLKVMTTKQFIMILSHFLKPICGTVQLDGSNYVEYIFNFMQSVDYPYANLSKSTLKTPSAPHCQNAIIFFLAWLAEFSVPRENVTDMIEFSDDATFLNDNFAKVFMDRTVTTFDLWNNENGEADVLIVETKKQYIEMKTGGSTSIEMDVQRLEADVENLRKTSRPASLAEELETKSKEYKTLRSTVEKSIARKNEQMKKCQVEKENLEKQKNVMKSLKKEIQTIQSQIKHQKMNPKTKVESLKNLSDLRETLAAEKELTQNLLEEASERDIELSKLVQKKFRLVGELNNFIFKLTSDMESLDLKSEERFDPSKFEIKCTKLGEDSSLNKELDKLVSGLDDVKRYLAEDEERLKQQKTSLLNEKAKLTSILEVANTEFADQSEFCDTQKRKIEKFEQETVQYVKDSMHQVTQYTIELQQLDTEIDKAKDFIEQLKASKQAHRDELEKFKAYGLAQCKELHEKKLKEHEELKKKLEASKALIASFNKIRKPLPENVQKMVDMVKKEYQDKQE